MPVAVTGTVVQLLGEDWKDGRADFSRDPADGWPCLFEVGPDADHWNGFEQPIFTVEVAREICTIFAEVSMDTFLWKETSDAFHLFEEGGVTQEEARRLPLESYSNYRIFLGERHGVVQRWVSLGEANWTWMVEPTVPFEF